MPKFFQKKLGDIAQSVGATLHGDADCIISGINTLELARPGELSFLQDDPYVPYLKGTTSSAVILAAQYLAQCPTNALVSRNPRLAYAQVVQLLLVPAPIPVPGVHPTAIVGEGGQIDATASIGPYCVLGDRVRVGANTHLTGHVQIGDDVHIGVDCHLYPKVCIYHEVQLGDKVIVHSGTVIGSDGFGFAPDHLGHWHKIPQFGSVRIGNCVEIGANVTIDRGAMGDTVLEDGVILDNQIQIAHNVHIGTYTAIAACTGIAGSTRIGAHCLIGGGTCINGHITIGNQVHISGMSMVTHSLPAKGKYSSGMPARESALWLRNVARFHRLDEMAKRVKMLEKKVKADD